MKDFMLRGVHCVYSEKCWYQQTMCCTKGRSGTTKEINYKCLQRLNPGRWIQTCQYEGDYVLIRKFGEERKTSGEDRIIGRITQDWSSKTTKSCPSREN